jgi:hypothetical protein
MSPARRPRLNGYTHVWKEDAVGTDQQRDERLDRLQVFAGEWRLEAPTFPLPAELAESARASFEWGLDRMFLFEWSVIPGPVAPDGLCVVGLDSEGGYTLHYFDSRGIARVYAMTFDGCEWTLERNAPDFAPLTFHQRWLGTFGSDGNTIEGRWESSPDGRQWELDFELFYHRVVAA